MLLSTNLWPGFQSHTPCMSRRYPSISWCLMNLGCVQSQYMNQSHKNLWLLVAVASSAHWPNLPSHSLLWLWLCLLQLPLELRFFLSVDFRFLENSILGNWVVLTKDVGWPFYRHSKHSQFVAQSLHQLHRDPHGNKLASKHWCLDHILAFGIPHYWCPVNKEQDTGLWARCHTVTCMVSVNKTMCWHHISTGFWHVPWNWLFCPSIKILPITLHKSWFINIRVLGVKCNINPTKFYSPLQDSNHLLVIADAK